MLVDWSQNDRHKTTVNVYSLRARPSPAVSTPVAWDEVSALPRRGDAELLTFGPGEVLDRVAADGDLFARCCPAQELPASESRAATRKLTAYLVTVRSTMTGRWTRSRLRNRLLVATGMWRDATGEPLPRMDPGRPRRPDPGVRADARQPAVGDGDARERA